MFSAEYVLIVALLLTMVPFAVLFVRSLRRKRS